ncbi:TPA: hypothetical protein ACF35N_004504 [Vibrio parahaemolyticus]
MTASSDIKKQVVRLCESFYQSGTELKKITGRLIGKESDFSHTAVTPYVKEWREVQYRIESDELKKTSMSDVLVKALHQEINARMQSLNALRDDEMEANRLDLAEAQENAIELSRANESLENKLKESADKNIQLERDLSAKVQEVTTLKATVSRLESEKIELQENSDRRTEELETKLTEQADKHQKQIEELNSQHAEAIADLKSEHAEAVTVLKSEHTQRITELSKSHSESVEELKSAHLSAQQQLRGDIEKVSHDLSEMTKQSSSKSEVIGQLRAELEDKEQIKSDMAEMLTKNRELEIQLHAAQHSAVSAVESVSKLEQELLDHKEQRNKAQTDLSKLNDAYSKLSDKYTTLLSERKA